MLREELKQFMVTPDPHERQIGGAEGRRTMTSSSHWRSLFWRPGFAQKWALKRDVDGALLIKYCVIEHF